MDAVSQLFEPEHFRVALYGQMILSLYGSLSFVYGTIHSSALATCLFALIAMEIKASRLLKIYVCVLIVFAFFDFTWLCMYTTAIATEKTGIKNLEVGNDIRISSAIRWGSAATRVNNWVCLFSEFVQFFVRLVSLPFWLIMWNKGLLEGTDSYEDPMNGNPVGPTRQAYHPPGDFSHVLPTGPVPEGRIVGHAGGRAEHDFTGFMQYQQQEEVESL